LSPQHREPTVICVGGLEPGSLERTGHQEKRIFPKVGDEKKEKKKSSGKIHFALGGEATTSTRCIWLRVIVQTGTGRKPLKEEKRGSLRGRREHTPPKIKEERGGRE